MTPAVRLAERMGDDAPKVRRIAHGECMREGCRARQTAGYLLCADDLAAACAPFAHPEDSAWAPVYRRSPAWAHIRRRTA